MTLSDFEKIILVLFAITMSLLTYILLRNSLRRRISKYIFLLFNIVTAIAASYFTLTNQFTESVSMIGLTLFVGIAVIFVVGENTAINVRIIRDD